MREVPEDWPASVTAFGSPPKWAMLAYREVQLGLERVGKRIWSLDPLQGHGHIPDAVHAAASPAWEVLLQGDGLGLELRLRLGLGLDGEEAKSAHAIGDRDHDHTVPPQKNGFGGGGQQWLGRACARTAGRVRCH